MRTIMKKTEPWQVDERPRRPVVELGASELALPITSISAQANRKDNLMPISVTSCWSHCLHLLEKELTSLGKSEDYHHYFTPIVPVSLVDNCLTIRVPSHYYYEFLEENYLPILRKVISQVLGQQAKLQYDVVVQGTQVQPDYTVGMSSLPIAEARSMQTLNLPPLPVEDVGELNPYAIPAMQHRTIESHLNPIFNMDSFVVGECNEVGYKMACCMTDFNDENPLYRALTLFGGTGVGKTHLMQAIGLEVKRNHPNKVVIYVSASEFMSQYQKATKNKEVPNFIGFYKSIDLLLIDDVHLLSGMHGTQKVFLDIYNKIIESNDNKRIVITINCSPKDLKGFSEQVSTRITWGLLAHMTMPDSETRLRILQRKAQRDGIESIPEEVFRYIAEHVCISVRELEGILKSLLAHSIVNKDHNNPERYMHIAHELVDSIVGQAPPLELTVEKIFQTVCEYYKLDPEFVSGATRVRPAVLARQVTHFLAKNHTSDTLQDIGRKVGGRSHSTVVHSYNTVKDQLEQDASLRNDIDELMRILL